jgi:hypothetical protein
MGNLGRLGLVLIYISIFGLFAIGACAINHEKICTTKITM